jgi:hypothetical protein
MTTHQPSTIDRPETLWRLSRGTRRLLLVVPPLALTVLTALHPQPDANPQAVADAATWFVAYHMIQLPLIGLVAVSVLVLADRFGRASAWPTCVGMGSFLLFFASYDTLAGIGTGLAMRSARELPSSEQDAVFDIVRDWPALDPAVLWLSLLGTGGWVLAVGYIAFVARASGASRAQWIPLGMAAFFLMGGHPFPFGTIAFGSLLVAVVVHERQTRRGSAVPASGEVAGLPDPRPGGSTSPSPSG